MRHAHLPLFLGVALALALAHGSAASADATDSPASFVKKAALSDMFETKSSELAAIKADAPTRAFAAAMNADHQKTSSQLGVIVKGRQADLPLPANLDAPRQKQIDRLTSLDGAAFTRQYRQDQLAAHAEAIATFESFAATGTDERLRRWASETVPKLKHHLQEAKALPVSTE